MTYAQPPSPARPPPTPPTPALLTSEFRLEGPQWGSLIACAAAALASGGLMAFGHLSNRPDAADKGKRALLWSLAGAAVVALAIPTLNTVFGAVS
jgi:hypothetical protein